jgi:broad specificity phosphatase PhoE
VSLVYLIRHGQAGPRDDYDRLSELGRKQARLLGSRLAREGLRFSAILSGTLERQRLTAELAVAASAEAGLEQPVAAADARWNEFDLDEVFRGIAPQLAAEDAAFRTDYEILQAALAAQEPGVHRSWMAANAAVVRAWVEGRYHYDGESWAGFNQRVAEAWQALPELGNGASIAVFTSATPAALRVGQALELGPRHVFRLAGATWNTGWSVLRMRSGGADLFSFNSAPHLEDERLRTFR